jgi:hypothetical protein
MSFYSDASLVLVPSGINTSKVYSIKPTDGSGDLTFTRASNASRVGPDGLIEKVRTNVVLYSEQLEHSTWVKSGLTVTANTVANPLTGTLTADKLVTDAATNFHYQGQSITYSAGEATASVYLKAAGYDWFVMDCGISNVYGYFNVNTGTLGTKGSACISSIQSVGNGWYRCSLRYTATAGAFSFNLSVRNADNGGSFLGDGVSGCYAFGAQVEQGVLTDYIPTTTSARSTFAGITVDGTSVPNVPRLDYTDSTCPKLLLEPQRTNLFTFSEQFDNAAWVGGGAGKPTVTPNFGISPDGYQNADKITATGSDYQLNQFLAQATTTYTISCWMRTNTGTTNINMYINNGQEGSLECAVTSEWQRFTHTVTTTTVSGGGRCGFFNREALNDSKYVLIWGAQLEQGAYSTSLISTKNAAVTRVSDSASKAGIASLIGQTEGTLFWDFNVLPSTLAGSYYLQAVLNDGTVSNQVAAAYYADGRIQFVAFVGGSLAVNINLPSYGLTVGKHKFAFAYKLNDYVAFVDGVSVGTDTSASVGAMSKLDLYETSGGTNAVNQALLFKTRLPNSDLATLTQL